MRPPTPHEASGMRLPTLRPFPEASLIIQRAEKKKKTQTVPKIPEELNEKKNIAIIISLLPLFITYNSYVPRVSIFYFLDLFILLSLLLCLFNFPIFPSEAHELLLLV